MTERKIAGSTFYIPSLVTKQIPPDKPPRIRKDTKYKEIKPQPLPRYSLHKKKIENKNTTLIDFDTECLKSKNDAFMHCLEAYCDKQSQSELSCNITNQKISGINEDIMRDNYTIAAKLNEVLKKNSFQNGYPKINPPAEKHAGGNFQYNFQFIPKHEFISKKNDLLINTYSIGVQTENSIIQQETNIDKGMIKQHFPDSQILYQALALYDFQGEISSDLPFKAGDNLKILKKINDNWLWAEKDNHVGQVPITFLQIIPSTSLR